MNQPCGQHQHPHRLIQQPLSELTERLRQGARKITAPRQAILDVLRRHQSPLSNREIHAALGPDNCDLATVYRNLHTLEDMGLVRRFDLGDNVARFELVADGDDGHHHHLVCRNCSMVVEIEGCFPADVEAAIAARHGFTQISHRLEFFGLCARCAEPSAAAPTNG